MPVGRSTSYFSQMPLSPLETSIDSMLFSCCPLMPDPPIANSRLWPVLVIPSTNPKWNLSSDILWTALEVRFIKLKRSHSAIEAFSSFRPPTTKISSSFWSYQTEQFLRAPSSVPIFSYSMAFMSNLHTSPLVFPSLTPPTNYAYPLTSVTSALWGANFLFNVKQLTPTRVNKFLARSYC